MRRDLKKHLFIGYQGALDSFFQRAQKLGLIHFIDPKQTKSKELPEDIQKITSAIKILREFPTLKQEAPEDSAQSFVITNEILELKEKMDKLEEERRINKLEISRIRVFGQFSLEDIAFIEKEGSRKVQYFFSKKEEDERTLPDELIYINSYHGLDYFVSINPESVEYPNMIEMKIDDELQSLTVRLNEIEKEYRLIDVKIKSFEKYNQFLHQVLVEKYNAYNLNTAMGYSQKPMDESLFAVAGWVPEDKIDKVKEMLEPENVYMTEIAIEEDEEAPTYLENEGASRIGEDLVNIYDTPSNTDRDPSLWVLVSFALFFSMIIGDGGYGLLFLLAALYFRFKNPKLKKSGKRVWSLVVILTTSCVFWGLLTNSFFGIKFDPDSSMRSPSIVHYLAKKKAAYHFRNDDEILAEWIRKYPVLKKAKKSQDFLEMPVQKGKEDLVFPVLNSFSDGIMMELALVVGMIHIMISLLRYVDRNWAAVGWVIAIIGSYMYIPKFLNASSLQYYYFGLDPAILANEGINLFYVGLVIALVLSLIQNKLFGLLEITNVIQIFADILSYLRLYALALAGSIISATVNDMAGAMPFAFLGLLILMIGHSINMLLSVIGGVIHGLRLNFIEWYHYCFEGGGKVFNPLRMLEID